MPVESALFVVRNLVIIKLGGSVITDKTSQKKIFRKEVVERLAREIKTAKNKGNFNLILIHGAGSFGHPLAKKYRLNEGFLNSRSSEGYAKTKIGVIELNFLVFRELERANLRACIVESSAVTTAVSGKIKKIDTEFIEFLLAQDIIPILSGDVVIDQRTGYSIISGDQIVSHLAKSFKADRVVFVSDVDGVFDKDPKVYPDAKLIPEINKKNYRSIIKNMRVKNKKDVTGEMKGKILSIKRGLQGVKVIITNGQIRGNVLKSLVDSNTQKIGTILRF